MFCITSFAQKGAGKPVRFSLLTLSLFVVLSGNMSLRAQGVSVIIEDISLKTHVESAAPDSASLLLFPNPAQQALTVRPTSTVAPEEVQIYAASSGTLLFQTLVNGPQTHSITLPAGLYLFRIRMESGEWINETVRILPTS